MEIMRQNDCEFGSNLEILRLGLGILSKRKNQKIQGLVIKTYFELKKNYDQIDFDIQTQESGKDILIRAKIQIDKLKNIFELPLDVTPEKFSTADYLLEKLFNCSKEYGKLPAYKNYRKNHQIPSGMSRVKWFELGKPTS